MPDQNLRWILGLPLVAFGEGGERSVKKRKEEKSKDEAVVPCRERAEI
jgi:hypothetical protein